MSLLRPSPQPLSQRERGYLADTPRPSPQPLSRGGEGLYRSLRVPVYVGVLAIGLRKRQTPAEQILWNALRNRAVNGHKFRRQHPLGRYILDFYCAKLRLALEVDGRHHFCPQRRAYDAVRTRFLAGCGIRVLRIRNVQVETNLPAVLETIRRFSPLPLGEGQG
jgi:very-short-patch-repair endonuclease